MKQRYSYWYDDDDCGVTKAEDVGRGMSFTTAKKMLIDEISAIIEATQDDINITLADLEDTKAILQSRKKQLHKATKIKDKGV